MLADGAGAVSGVVSKGMPTDGDGGRDDEKPSDDEYS